MTARRAYGSEGCRWRTSVGGVILSLVRRPRRPADEETVDSSRQVVHQAPDVGAANRRAVARLVAVHPPELQAVVELDAEHPVVLGRAPEDPSTPPLLHPTVSRSHFRIEWAPSQGIHVGRDLGSRNGSRVDGTVAAGTSWRPLGEGAVLRVGDVLLVYERGHTLEVQDPPHVSREAVPGNAQSMRQLRARIARAAPDISPVLIIGETGTGKERIAAELHRLSGRRGELVAINCATLGEQLVESQLFGHVKGAFTGASTDQPGLFRAAENGTLFLDEIGEMPLDLQPKLLRSIQEREVRPVGSTRTIEVDVRIVAATHRNLADKARTGAFRQDLYARLALWQLDLPALRERKADVLFWVERLRRVWAESRGLPVEPLLLTAEAAERLLLSPWLENLRGVDRFVHELAVAELDPTPLGADDLPRWIGGEPG